MFSCGVTLASSEYTEVYLAALLGAAILDSSCACVIFLIDKHCNVTL